MLSILLTYSMSFNEASEMLRKLSMTDVRDCDRAAIFNRHPYQPQSTTSTPFIMRFLRPCSALLLGGLFLTACGGNQADVSTSTPTSTLGTDSAAAKVGGTPPDSAAAAPSAGLSTGTGR
jgi:hypothetical protein